MLFSSDLGRREGEMKMKKSQTSRETSSCGEGCEDGGDLELFWRRRTRETFKQARRSRHKQHGGRRGDLASKQAGRVGVAEEAPRVCQEEADMEIEMMSALMS